MNRNLVKWVLAGAIIAGAAFALLSPASVVNKTITAEELTQLQSSGAWVIDVRTNSEYISGHIPNALNIPLDELPKAAATWSTTQPIIVYCATGARSAEAATLLAERGFREVYDLGGVVTWTGELEGGQSTTPVPAGPGVVDTEGLPIFIDFASST
ncbi:MAG: rhodanese-like domain-containing protein [Coriobacteriia bacterium]|nr:rhodanese-like domain-containing protein [Coriobacteriia bacterium]MDO9107445.1 rhodanese-like domain-containing protein [Coriobacteriia bacterium]